MKRKRDKSRKRLANEALTRRDFLKGASAAVSGGLLAGQAALASAAPSGGEVVGPGAVPITLQVNDKSHQLTLEPRVTLLDTLRNRLDLTGAKRVCDRGVCGSCTVMMDGKPVYACNILAIEAQGHDIMTIECLAEEGKLSPNDGGLRQQRCTAVWFLHTGLRGSVHRIRTKTSQPEP